MKQIKGKAWVFGDHIDTDLINPGKYMNAPREEAVKHVFEAIRPEFASNFKPGDIIVAGRNFGCGSSRETAPDIFKALGVGAIVAGSFARIFFRNAVALGIPVVTLPEAPHGFSDGDQMEVVLETAVINNLKTGQQYTGKPLYQDILNILNKGGMVSVIRELVERKAAQVETD